jgi:CTP:molybdopterin cytidylyltransferase MocA
MTANKKDLTGFSVLILAAGFSGRMGVPKLSLPFDRNQTFMTKIIRSYQSAGCEKIVVVVNKPGQEFLKQHELFSDKSNISVAPNAFPERERFYSLQTGLETLQDGKPVFIQNIDNPFVRPALLHRLAEVFKPGAFVVPVYNERGGHPVLLSGKIISDLVTFPDYRQNLRDFLQAYPKINCPVEDKKILVNINSPQEYGRYFGGLNQVMSNSD